MAKDVGRPTNYKKSFNRQAYVACLDGGFTDAKLAKLFDIDNATLNRWKRRYPEFCASIQKGKDEFNCVVAENSLIKRVKGFSYNETTKEYFGLDENMKPIIRETKKVRKHIPPDPHSIKFFLKNRDPVRWPDREVVEVEGLDKLGERLDNAHKRMKDASSPD